MSMLLEDLDKNTENGRFLIFKKMPIRNWQERVPCPCCQKQCECNGEGRRQMTLKR